jgi:hypothetical protein
MQSVVKQWWLALGMVLSLPLSAQTVTSAYTGSWFDPASPGQGFLFEVIPTAEGNDLLVYFATFDVDGVPTFLVGRGPIEGRVADLVVGRPVLPPNAQPIDGMFPTPDFVVAGTVRVQFDDCGAATADFEIRPRPGVAPSVQSKIRVGTGSLRLQRAAPMTVQAKRCTGGVVDDLLPADLPVGFERFYTGTVVDARVYYQRRPERAELEFDLRALPAGQYQLKIGTRAPRRFAVLPNERGTRARLRYSSPATAQTALLDFEPRGALIQVLDDRGRLVDQFFLPGRLNPLDVRPSGMPVHFGEWSLQREYTATELQGATANLRAPEAFLLTVDYEAAGEVAELELAVDADEPAAYDVVVDGKRQGTVYVAQRNNGVVAGSARFRRPSTAGSYPLEFDPRGKQILFVQNNQVVFGFDFPTD